MVRFIGEQGITDEDIGYRGARLRNAPDTRSWRRGFGLPVPLITGAVFLRADKEPAVRQLYEIAELGKRGGEPTNCPRFKRLLPAPGQCRIEGDEVDFRDEILAHIFDRGDASPKRSLIFDIAVADEGTVRGTPVFQRRKFKKWRQIGRIIFGNGVASYNGNFVIHFNHPTWRSDRNDPATATRVDGRKKR